MAKKSEKIEDLVRLAPLGNVHQKAAARALSALDSDSFKELTKRLEAAASFSRSLPAQSEEMEEARADLKDRRMAAYAKLAELAKTAQERESVAEAAPEPLTKAAAEPVARPAVEPIHASSPSRPQGAVTMQELIEAGAHFGHQTHRWNPRMKPYIFGARNGVHIIDLSQTVPLFARALDFVKQTVRAGGKVLFVGTKRQAQEPIAEAARQSGQHFVNHRWLGGMLTNWKTISGSIRRLKTLEEQLSGDTSGFTKKEVLQLTRERDKLGLYLGGIRDMGGAPDVMFVIDANKEDLAIKEAAVLGVPVIAVLDSNVDPTGIAFPVPGNDDASRAVRLYCQAIAGAAIEGRGGTIHSDEAVGKTMGASALTAPEAEMSVEDYALNEIAQAEIT